VCLRPASLVASLPARETRNLLRPASYAGKNAFAHHGERVVQGQRLMQPASDLFLGWATGPQGRQFHLRQLRNVKLSPLVETYDAEMLSIYAQAAAGFWRERMRKRAIPGRLVAIWASRMNSTRRWVNLPSSYTDQAERDHAALAAAVRAGAIDVNLER